MVRDDPQGILKSRRPHVLLNLFQVNQPVLQLRVSVRKAHLARQDPAMKASKVWRAEARVNGRARRRSQ
jgi:hypothetical protein